ncbi:hypothetical protein [Lignipirellula cremea]|uniref:Uncharacterized protein n=1 Tax=Lignipirellula cremea TaxID=2528010 RepID=A0A518DKP3_9BACT|nr:hypothetical protein [Lignipirellula cremea]QDU92404.1 hypothetical protein Pla8534_01520 [Lignipirellula cremea]
MNAFVYTRRSMRVRAIFGVLLSMTLLGMSNEVQAVCGLGGAYREQLRSVDDPLAARTLSLKVQQRGCSVCHLASFGGPRNEYGNAVNTLLKLADREDSARQREVGRRMRDILANPSLPNSPTFGELIQLGRLPATALATQELPLPEVPAKVSEDITLQQARELVQQVEAESRFGILQLSRTYEITPEVAAAFAEFRGEMLILGIRKLSPEVASALAQSQAANVWLHSVNSVSPEAADAIIKLRGHLYLTSLAELNSVPLAEKLASRPGALSFPYLKTITREIAAALAKNDRSLTLAGLTDVSPEVQDKLAETVGGLALPNLTSLDSLPLVKKLAAGIVLLPRVGTLTPEQADILIGVKGQGSFFGAVYLSTAAVTPDVAGAIANKNTPVNLILIGGGPLPDEVLRSVLKSRLNLTLQDVEELTPEQIRIVADGLAGTTSRPGVLEFARLSLPKLQKLDSAILAETLVKSTGFNFPSVTEIAPEVAAALGSLPDQELKLRDGTVQVRPSGSLSFPSLTELSPETARLLLKKRWASISLPSVQDISLETIRALAQNTSSLTLGIPALPPEFADAFSRTPIDTDVALGGISFPHLKELSPESARILVKSLNRGIQVNGQGRTSKSPSLVFGTLLAGSLPSGFSLSPETAVELAKYDGSLSFRLGELPDESARALSSFDGVYLEILGPAVEQLTPDAAAALAKTPATLQLPVRELDSVPLAERFAWQYSRSFYAMESISKEAIPALVKYRQIFDVRKIEVLDSPELARRFVEGGSSGGVTLPALTSLSLEAAEILAAGSKSSYLGLTVLDSSAVATALSKAEKGVKLPRLRAATPEVIAILKEAKSIETPPFESVYVLPK